MNETMCTMKRVFHEEDSGVMKVDLIDSILAFFGLHA